jgi:hypothetical protein
MRRDGCTGVATVRSDELRGPEAALIRAQAPNESMGSYHRATVVPLLGVDEAEIDDDSLLERLSEVVAILDPVPECVDAGARAMFRPHGRTLSGQARFSPARGSRGQSQPAVIARD